MKLGIMQPYFFPYIGYFQLIQSVDLFVLHDDVQFIKSGWVHRNRYLRDGEAVWFGLALAKAPSTARINERVIAPEFDRREILRRLDSAYRLAPHRNTGMRLLEEVLSDGRQALADLDESCIRKSCAALDIHTPIMRSSELRLPASLKGQERVVEIARRTGADVYINPIGGIDLYEKDTFAAAGIELLFHRCEGVVYEQLGSAFVPDLSIVDVLMFNDSTKMASLLRCRRIADPAAFTGAP